MRFTVEEKKVNLILDATKVVGNLSVGDIFTYDELGKKHFMLIDGSRLEKSTTANYRDTLLLELPSMEVYPIGVLDGLLITNPLVFKSSNFEIILREK